jgi:short-subunit dehydrogenase
MEYLHQSNGFDETILRRHYGYFKNKLAKDLAETRVKIMTLKPGSILSTSSHEQGAWDSIKAPDDVSTAKYLNEYLKKEPRVESQDTSLQIW